MRTWVEYWQECTRGTMALVHYYGGLQDKGWLAWREVVEMSELERGGGARKQLVYRR